MAEIANAIIFLTSEQASKVTGHIMKVDGGKSLTTSDFKPQAASSGVLTRLGSMLPMKKAGQQSQLNDRDLDEWI